MLEPFDHHQVEIPEELRDLCDGAGPMGEEGGSGRGEDRHVGSASEKAIAVFAGTVEMGLVLGVMLDDGQSTAVGQLPGDLFDQGRFAATRRSGESYRFEIHGCL